MRGPDKILANIPAGVESGMQLRLENMGDYGGAGKGDLYVRILVKEHKTFEREGRHLLMHMDISFPQAALGAEIEVPTLFGKAKLKVPAGTQTGTTFRLRGEGLPELHGHGNGDELVKVTVKVPEKLSAKQKKLLEEYEEDGKKEKKFGIF
jgi:molecular chaperone DnaJ